MWLFTRFGFFSIVRKPGDADDTLTLRSRTRGDLLRLKRHHLPVLQDPVAQPGSPYPWRAGCPAEALAWAMPGLVRDIDYPHFRDEVALSLGADRAARHTRVWHALFGLPDDLPEPLLDGPPATGVVCGGVVMDRNGRVLLRCLGDDPADDRAFTGGSPAPGETPRAAALRAVQQATGARVDLIAPLPGHAFLMVDRKSVV